jgi:hypothetical protein
MLKHPRGKRAVVLGVVAAVAVAAGIYILWATRPPQWFAVVYSNAANRDDYDVIGRYHTPAACRDALRNEFAERRLWGAGGPQVGWECQTDCMVRDDRTIACDRIETGLDLLD